MSLFRDLRNDFSSAMMAFSLEEPAFEKGSRVSLNNVFLMNEHYNKGK
jgi:hypothetical protein